MASNNDDRALRVGEKLVHIGPLKTGTTVVQGAFHSAREELAHHDVRYAGQQRQALRAVFAGLGRSTPVGWDPIDSDWQALTEEVTAATDQRVVVSSEFFSDADAATAARMVEELGGSSVRIVVTLRPLAKIAPSYWQYAVQTGARIPYETWLERAFADRSGKGAAKFWRRQRHDELVERWAAAVGPDRLTVVVVDDTDRSMVLRTFESLVGLPEGFLVPEPSGDVNRSLTYGEVELLRGLNVELQRLGIDRSPDGREVRRGVVLTMRSHPPRPEDHRFPTPAWALRRCAEIGAEMAGRIAGSGVRVIGDLSTLSREAEGSAGSVAVPARTISVELALRAVLGTLLATKPELGGIPDAYSAPSAASEV